MKERASVGKLREAGAGKAGQGWKGREEAAETNCCAHHTLATVGSARDGFASMPGPTLTGTGGGAGRTVSSGQLCRPMLPQSLGRFVCPSDFL